MLLGFLADVWQWASSVPSGREWADALGELVDSVIKQD